MLEIVVDVNDWDAGLPRPFLERRQFVLRHWERVTQQLIALGEVQIVDDID